ncbi:hypothetical protein ACLOJK_020819 [Asimina triloba]
MTLDESSQSKDPLFSPEPPSCRDIPHGSSIPCKISFAKGEEKDILLIPKAKGILGKLFLVERLLDQSPGVVIAVAPLAGLNPLIDENQSTWLHLRIRDYDLQIEASKIGRHQASASNPHPTDRRWTLGFASSEDCEAAQSTILRETSEQRSSVESLLSPFFMHSFKTLSSGSEDDGKQE